MITPCAQVREAVLQAGGKFAAAQELCRRTAAAQASLLKDQPAAAAQQQQTAAQLKHRRWWPKSKFCPTQPAACDSGGGSALGAAKRTLLVPHQVLRSLPRSPNTPSPARSCTQHQASMQHQAGHATQAGVGRQEAPAALPVRAAAASASGAGTSSSAGGGSANPAGILKRAAASPTPDPPQGPSAAAASAPNGALSPPRPQGLRPHYAAVFLTEKSRAALLQHAPPLHETVSADHMTLAYRPTPEACTALPLGRDVPLFVAGAAADYRTQAVAVQPPSWLPFLSDSAPHVTVSGGCLGVRASAVDVMYVCGDGRAVGWGGCALDRGTRLGIQLLAPPSSSSIWHLNRHAWTPLLPAPSLLWGTAVVVGNCKSVQVA
jgi:hypothetical protein